MKRDFSIFAWLIGLLFVLSQPAFGGGTTAVQFGFASILEQHVPLSCLTDLSSCGGSFAVTNQSDFPFLNKISITHSDPPSGIFQSCDKVSNNPSGNVLVYGQRVAPKDEPRWLYFALNRPLCSFSPGDYRWFSNADYPKGDFGWTPTRPAIIDPADIQTMCRNNKGKTVTVVKRFQVSLHYNNGKDEDVGPTQSLVINFHCPSPPPYLGCYQDDSSRKLPVVLSSSSTMSIEQCVAAAHAKNLTYAGLQFGGQCFGGNTLAGSDLAKDQSECNMPCSADKSEVCGGTWRNSVYYAKEETGSASPPVFLGCYVDDSSRKLPVVLSSSSTMSIEQCLSAARQQGLVYAGLQYGGQCYGGNSLSNSTLVDAGQCNMHCNAAPNESCGGTWRNSVYLSGYPPSACAKGLTACNGDCKDISNDWRNCGSCGHVCSGGCQVGQCVAPFLPQGSSTSSNGSNNQGNPSASHTCPSGTFWCQGACQPSGGSCPYQGSSAEYYCPAGTHSCPASISSSLNTCCCSDTSGTILQCPGGR